MLAANTQMYPCWEVAKMMMQLVSTHPRQEKRVVAAGSLTPAADQLRLL